MPIRIEKWRVVSASDNPYLPTDVSGIALVGEVYGHPRFADGYEIRTSRIVAAEGLSVYTKTGSCYLLGEVSRDYVDWCRDEGIVLNPEQPIRVTV